MGRSVHVEHLLPYKINDVWGAITTPRVLKEWCLQTNFKLKKNKPFYFRDTSRKKELLIHCRVVDFEENRMLCYTWGDKTHVPTLVTYTLTETPKGTKLQVEHSGFEGVHGFFACKNFGSVWKKMIMFELPKAMEKFNYKKAY